MYTFIPEPHFFAEYIHTIGSQYSQRLLLAIGGRRRRLMAGNIRLWSETVSNGSNAYQCMAIVAGVANYRNVRQGLLTEAYFANGCQYLLLVSNGCRWLLFRSTWFKIEPDSELSSTRLV